MKNLNIQFVSHACLKITGEYGTLLCDPWFLNEPIYNFTTWKFPAAVIPPEEVVKDVDYVYITHTHEDHFHAPSIDYFSRDTVFLLPEFATRSTIRNYTAERTLRQMGFYNIIKLKPWETFYLKGKTPFTSIPSAVSREHDWENSGFVIEHPDCKMINMNDNLSDISLCNEIIDRWGYTFDIGFIQGAGVTMFPGRFRMSEDELKKAAESRNIALMDQRRMLDLIRPKRIVPFAGDFCWIDEKYFRNNWCNRSTPALFEQFLKTDYPNRDLELIKFNPSDSWNIKDGLTTRHPDIDWNNYLDEIKKVQTKFAPKLEQINEWIDSSSSENLIERTKEFIFNIQKHISKEFVNFEAAHKISIENTSSKEEVFSFIVRASREEGFIIELSTDKELDQTLHVDEKVWASILEGKLMWGIIQWTAEHTQHKNYRIDSGRLWFWMELFIDLNNKLPQIIIDDRLFPHLETKMNYTNPQHGVFQIDQEWDLPWYKNKTD